MATVFITLTDNDNGTVDQIVDYGDKFDVNSQAHQYSGILLKLGAEFLAKDQPQIVVPG